MTSLVLGRSIIFVWASQVALVAKNLPANVGDIRDAGSIPWLGRSTGGGNGNPLQYSCLENPMGRGAWWTTVHVITQSDMTERLSTTAVKSPSPTQWTARELPMKLA